MTFGAVPGEGESVAELLDPDHPRASLSDGDRMLIEPGRVLHNIVQAMEQVNRDIDTPISIEEDVASLKELVSMIEHMMMGPSLAIHVVNNALQIMTAGTYPEALVRAPFPPEYDLRKLFPVFRVNDELHETARTIFNQRTARETDLTEADVDTLFEPLDRNDQLQIFCALFYMYGTKIGAMKHRMGA